MPKSPKTHTYDGLANDYLKKVFPRHWHFKQSREMDSGREYGIDLIIEVVDDQNDEVTGYEFIVQNKKATVRNKHISVSIETDSIRYLCTRRGEAVLLHAFDVDKKIGYWIWLKDWFAKANKSKINKQEKINVQIPKSNLLTLDTVPELLRYVQSKHRKTMLRDMADYHSDADPNFRFDFFYDETFDQISFLSKKAFPISDPISNFEPLLDSSQQKYLNEAIEFGKRIQLNTFKPPEFLEWTTEVIGTDVNWFVELIPELPEFEMPLKIQFLDSSGATLYEVNYIKLKLVQRGSKYSLLKGSTHRKDFELGLESEDELPSNLHFALHPIIETNKDKLDYLLTLKNLKNTISVVLTNLEINGTVTVDARNHEFDISWLNDQFIELLESLVTIEEKLDVKFTIPDEIYDKDHQKAVEIANIVKFGKSYQNYFFPPEMLETEATSFDGRLRGDLSYAEQFYNADDPSESNLLIVDQTRLEAIFSLFGQEINLGIAYQVLHVTKWLYIDELRKLIDEDIPKDTGFYIFFEFDPKLSFTEFPDWLPETED
ncbi:MAG: DUF4365 domain-containing protein [Aggregatilineales bacterium]